MSSSLRGKVVSIGGGANNQGTVFELVNNGGSFNQTILYNFAGGSADGANPTSNLVMDASGDLLGTTELGGSTNDGTVFELTLANGAYTESLEEDFEEEEEEEESGVPESEESEPEPVVAPPAPKPSKPAPKPAAPSGGGGGKPKAKKKAAKPAKKKAAKKPAKKKAKKAAKKPAKKKAAKKKPAKKAAKKKGKKRR